MRSDIKIKQENNLLLVYCPYNKDFISAAKDLNGRWETEYRNGPIHPKAWIFDYRKQSEVEKSLEEYFPENENTSLSNDNTEAIATTVVEVFSQTFREYATPLRRELNNNITNMQTDLTNAVTGMRTDNKNTVIAAAVLIDKKAAELQEKMSAFEQKIAATKTLEIKIHSNGVVKTKNIGLQHKAFELLLELATSLEPEDRNIWLAGPAGSGKTTAARKLAEALDRDFEFNGAIDTEYKLSGFVDANGRIVSTAFRKAWEEGKVYLFDECDASMAGALLAFNAALANGHAAFPDQTIMRHANTVIIAAANTWGFGGDGNYVGRAKLDAAFLDRFVTVTWDYDENLETLLADNLEWCTVVQKTRELAMQNGAQVVISPRASIKGSQLLRAGLSREKVVEAIFGRYKSNSKWEVLNKYIKIFLENKKEINTAPFCDNRLITTIYLQDYDRTRKISGIKFIQEVTGQQLLETKIAIEGNLPYPIRLKSGVVFNSKFLMDASEAGLNIRAS